MSAKLTIPKILHYCWFGEGQKPEILDRCLASWKKYCPDFEIIEWNENNLKSVKNPYFISCLKNKKWAFASDYARFKILYENGGIYLDTDEELLADINNFLHFDLFLGFEKYGAIVSPMGGIIGAKKLNPVIGRLLNDYDKIQFEKEPNIFDFTPITARLKQFFSENYALPEAQNAYEIFEFDTNSVIFPANYFCKYSGIETIAVHHYSFSWQNDVLPEKYLIFKDKISNRYYLSIYFIPQKTVPQNINARVFFKCNFFGYTVILVRHPV